MTQDDSVNTAPKRTKAATVAALVAALLLLPLVAIACGDTPRTRSG